MRDKSKVRKGHTMKTEVEKELKLQKIRDKSYLKIILNTYKG